MYKTSLEIAEKVGLLEVTATDYSNLGSVYKQRGDDRKAKEYWAQALDLFKKIGMPNEVKEVEGWLEKIKEK
jgi:tetratricopeptide (TPR) repeat protein